ncbi:MAG: rubredoxin [archaeon]|nr:rubredoxin [archaeon]MCP8306789.1 rubredoxin [archaeon]
MARWKCTVCNYIYDEEKKGKRFRDLASDWVCPICGAPKSAFIRIGKEVPKEKVVTVPNVAEKIVEQLSAIGVKYIYGIPGDSNLPLVEALRRQNSIKFILTRHEETAAFMASAHAKLTDEIGVCLSIAGPGATNLITGLMDAATDGAPVLALIGQVPQAFLGSESLQEIDQIELFRPFTVFNETIATPAQAINLTMLAVKNAYLKRGVAMLSLPTDVLSEELEDEIWKAEEHLFKQIVAPTEEDIEKAAKFIDESRRPIILGGWGIRNCGKEVIELSERISAPIATTSRAKGVIPETHDLAVGVLGSIGTLFAAKAMTKADLIIIVGSGFRQRNLVPHLPIVQIDIDGVKLGKSFPIKVGLTGDAKAVLKKLMEKVSEKKPDKKYFDEIKKIKEEYLEEIREDSRNISVPIYPGFVIQAIKRHSEKNVIICVDVGDHTYWFYKKYICEGEKTLLSSNLASMAFALPASLSAQIDFPNRQVICVTGDGGFGMLMADFTTAVYNRLPIKVVLFNDRRLKNIKKEQTMYGYKEFGTEFVNPNFADFAKSCSGEGYRVERPEELDRALEQAFKSDKPAIVDVVVDPEKMAPMIRRAE